MLELLLRDQTTGKKILWGTDSYKDNGKGFAPKNNVRAGLVTGIYGQLIQPRAAKKIEEQRQRTIEKGEVFTPLSIVRKMNSTVDQAAVENQLFRRTWKDYVSELKLEIACGEAPFIFIRYNPTAHTVK